MYWNDHHDLVGKHAYLSPSGYHWLGWTDDVFATRFYNQYATTIGTLVHALASNCIKHRIKLHKHDTALIECELSRNYIPKESYDSSYIIQNVAPFVNDAIGFRLDSEVILYYSKWCFGTTDAIRDDTRLNILRISDYKNGQTPAKFDQLMIYAALYCLEYHKKPESFKKIELRLYQNLETSLMEANPEDISKIMERIVYCDSMINTLLNRGFTEDELKMVSFNVVDNGGNK